jgi:acetyl esterase/lipase
MQTMNKRSLLYRGAALTIALCLGIADLWAQQPIKLWQHIHGGCPKVTLTSYLPADTCSKRTAIIVCPGGSYCWLDKHHERGTVAQWLQNEGIVAFVLLYRTQGVMPYVTHSRLLFPRHQYPTMLQDLQQAICYIRENAKLYGIDPNKIGVMGFSAGGHLAMLSGEWASHNFLESLGITSQVSLRPNFLAAIYPVVTLSDKRFVHKRSRRGLLGEYKKFSTIMRDSLSLEKHVSADMPPVFLMNCIDDPIVKYQNSELLDSALTDKGVHHLYKQYKTGGHGFGSNPSSATEALGWKLLFVNWLKKIGF